MFKKDIKYTVVKLFHLKCIKPFKNFSYYKKEEKISSTKEKNNVALKVKERTVKNHKLLAFYGFI